MTEVKGLISVAQGEGLNFGNYELDTKTKVSDFEYMGDTYKVKSFKELTKLEKNELFVYESVPGTVVTDFVMEANDVSFKVEGYTDTQIVIGLEPETEYKVMVDGVTTGFVNTNLGGKLVFSTPCTDKAQEVKIFKINK